VYIAIFGQGLAVKGMTVVSGGKVVRMGKKEMA